MTDILDPIDHVTIRDFLGAYYFKQLDVATGSGQAGRRSARVLVQRMTKTLLAVPDDDAERRLLLAAVLSVLSAPLGWIRRRP